MKRETRRQTMAALAKLAREHDRRGDAVMRSQFATQWMERATDAEMKNAPRYLTWRGRK